MKATKTPTVRIMPQSLEIMSQKPGSRLATIYLTLAKLICLVKKGGLTPLDVIDCRWPSVCSFTSFSDTRLSIVTNVLFESPFAVLKSTSFLASLMCVLVDVRSVVESSSNK